MSVLCGYGKPKEDIQNFFKNRKIYKVYKMERNSRATKSYMLLS